MKSATEFPGCRCNAKTFLLDCVSRHKSRHISPDTVSVLINKNSFIHDPVSQLEERTRLYKYRRRRLHALPFSFALQIFLRILPGVGLGRTTGSRQPVVAIFHDHGDWRCPFERLSSGGPLTPHQTKQIGFSFAEKQRVTSQTNPPRSPEVAAVKHQKHRRDVEA